MTLRRTLKGLALAGAFSLAAGSAGAQTTYNFSTSVDFTGPFADVMDSWHSGHRAFVAWWNDTKGKELGVQVELKVHDHRYDTSVIARDWPSILSSDEPVLHLGMGTPDLVGLMKRLPEDEVPMIMPTAMVGLVWAPDGWHYSFRPTYSHEFAGLFNHMQQDLEEDRPLRIATVSTQGRAGYEDQVAGVVHLTEMYPDRFAIANQQWVDDNPVNITDQIRRMSETDPDVIMVGATTAQVVATVRALKDLGLDIPVVSSSHNGLTEVAKAVDLEDLEGSLSVFSFAPYNEEGLEAAEVYEQYHDGKGDWGIVAAQASAQTVLALRVLEAAIEAEGVEGVTGPVMYQALLDNGFSSEQMLGLTPDLEFDSSAPFPVGEIKAKAMVVRDGEIVPLTEDWLEVPELTKW